MSANFVWEWTEAYTALDINADTAHCDFKNTTAEIEKHMINRLGNPDNLVFLNQEDAKKSEIVYKGSA